MRQFWFFTTNDGGVPHFPAGVTPRRCSYVGALYRLGTTAGHAHLWLGGLARPDARLDPEVAGAFHFHDLVWYSNQWNQITTGAANHTHSVPDAPDWWLVCALLRDADVAACAADSDMFNIGEIVDGALSTETWDAGTQATWTARMLNGLYLASWGLLLYATFLINHFDLFGLRQAWHAFRNHEPEELSFVTPALYRIVRHPLYVGWLGIFWFTPVMTMPHLALALGTTAYILVAIQLEERDLERAHPEYAQYKRKVPALIPSFRRRLHASAEATVA